MRRYFDNIIRGEETREMEVQAHLKSMMKLLLTLEGIPARRFSCAGPSWGLRAGSEEEVLHNFS